MGRNFWRTAAILGASGAVLSACNSGSQQAAAPATDALAQYRTQTLDWQPCGATYQARMQDMQMDGALKQRVSCAMMRVPTDYRHPERGDLEVELLRIAANHPDGASKTLFVNPGGPGGSGTGLALSLAAVWADATDRTERGRLTQQLAAQYDLIGFAPRGVANSTAVICPVDAPMTQVPGAPGSFNEAIFRAQVAQGAQLAAACQSQPFAAHINTANTVQDLDVMRAVVGDERLNYLGYSYGTWLGMWYAGTFPDRVGNMVLDSVMNFDIDLYHAFAAQGDAAVSAYEEWFYVLASAQPERYGLGRTPAAVAQSYRDIAPELQNFLLGDMYSGTVNAAGMQTNLFLIAGAKAVTDVVAAIDRGATGGQTDVHVLLEDYVFADVQAPAEMQRLRAVAHQIYASWVDSQTASGDFDGALDRSGSLGTNLAVRCSDDPWPLQDVTYFRDRAQAVVDRGVPFNTEQGYACLYWQGGERAPKPALQAVGQTPILMVQAEYDVRTPTPGALQVWQQTPGVELVYVPGEIKHGLYPYLDDCVDLAVLQHLGGQLSGQRRRECATQVTGELALPSLQARAGTAAVRLMAEPPQEDLTYANPARVQRLSEEIQQWLR